MKALLCEGTFELRNRDALDFEINFLFSCRPPKRQSNNKFSPDAKKILHARRKKFRCAVDEIRNQVLECLVPLSSLSSSSAPHLFLQRPQLLNPHNFSFPWLQYCVGCSHVPKGPSTNIMRTQGFYIGNYSYGLGQVLAI